MVNRFKQIFKNERIRKNSLDKKPKWTRLGLENNRNISKMKMEDTNMKVYLSNERLCQIMDSMNLNASDIVELTGWNATKVSRIINSQRELTSSEIQELSEALDVLESDFFREGYVVVGDSEEESLGNLLVNAGEMYASTERGVFQGSEVGEIIRKELPAAIVRKTSIDSRDYKVEGSIGKGQYAEVAWISIFDRSITESATRGIYIVFLYSVDGKSVYLSLNQGYTYFSEKFSSKEARKEIVNMADVLRGYITVNNSRFVNSIDLGAQKALGRGYEAGHIIGMKYEFDNMPSDIDIVRDIFDLLSIYKSIRTLFAGRTVDKFYDFLVAQGRGLINLKTIEEEVNTTNVVESTEIQIIDEPKAKQEAVIDDKGTRRFPRDPQVAARALSQGKYLCTYNNEHFTFKAKGSDHMYVEAHHLIPISESDKFVTSIDVEANIVSLCSICHDCIHHGTDEDKYELIKKLYIERKDRLEKAGVFVSLEQLLSFYGINLKNNA